MRWLKMRRKIILQIACVCVTAAAGCAADDVAPSETGRPRTSFCEDNGLSSDTCALVGTRETLSCASAPGRYVRARIGLSLRINCSAVGDFPGTGGIVDRISPKVESEKTFDLADNEDMWPTAECELDTFVDSYSYPGTGIPYQQKRITARMWVESGAVLLATDAPELAPSTKLEDCQ
jgi:hypothetical protein